ncbi:MAG: hypothetical protein NUV49_01815 [Patescibacteria group bacterium]|nr:hypothetical protein [Patescibacteria group bacterium]
MSLANVEIKSLENSEVEIKAEISSEEFEQYRDQVVRRLSVNIEVPGFRKGNVPEKILVQKIGEMPILEEMAETAISHAYPKILMEHKIDAIGRPEVNITKIAKGSSLGFSIKTAVMPEVKLSDYKKAAQEEMAKKEEVTLEEKEVEDTIAEIRKQRAHVITADEPEENTSVSDTLEEKSEAKNSASKKPDLPELNDEFVKTLGDFKSVEDFKKKLRENMLKEKEVKAAQKKRMAIIKKVITQTDITLPPIIVESELDKMMAQFQGDIARMGLKFDEYLKYIKKTTDDLRKEWLADAIERAKAQLVLHKIAVEEKITVPEEEIEKETKKLVEYYKDASPDRARDYVVTVLTNEAVFKFLEKEG